MTTNHKSKAIWVGLLVLTLLACNLAGGATSTATSTATPPATTVAATAAAPPSPTAAPARTFDLSVFKRGLDPAVAAYLSADNVAGCAVGIVYPDPSGQQLVSQSFSYGLASRATQQPVTAATLFEIGSITKVFTSDLLALFVTQNRMALTDPLQKYLPATVHVPTYGQQAITLVELATHTSSLPRTPGLPAVRDINGVSVFGYATESELFAALSGYQLTHAPGTQWLYSNFANSLLGLAEEKASGTSYESGVVNQIIGPLGLAHTRITLTPAEQANLAQGYTANGQPAPSVANSGASLAAGALRSNIQDMDAYLIANIDPGATRLAAPLRLTQQRQSIGPRPNVVMGLGWMIINPGAPSEQFAKDGATAGYTAYAAYSTRARTGFAALCNGHNVSQDLAPKINQLIGASETVSDDATP